MDRRSTWLLEYKRNVYSQTGEDGIIDKILEIIPENDKWCVEFGAWDGLFLTNTRHLIESKDYSAILIEANRDKFAVLKSNYLQYDNVITINEYVGFEDYNNLDHILNGTAIPLDFDLLSIDIDGNDYHVWNAMSNFQPKLVVVEFNPTIPTHIRFVQAADPLINQGSSLLSLVELGKEKGYELVSVLPFNAFFIRKEYYPLFCILSNSPEDLRTDLSSITYLFSGYDGTVYLRGLCRLPWHGITLQQSNFQVLPKVLRKYPDMYSKPQKTLFQLLFQPDQLFKSFGMLLLSLPRQLVYYGCKVINRMI